MVGENGSTETDTQTPNPPLAQLLQVRRPFLVPATLQLLQLLDEALRSLSLARLVVQLRTPLDDKIAEGQAQYGKAQRRVQCADDCPLGQAHIASRRAQCRAYTLRKCPEGVLVTATTILPLPLQQNVLAAAASSTEQVKMSQKRTPVVQRDGTPYTKQTQQQVQ
jgi:hypothetical protein